MTYTQEKRITQKTVKDMGFTDKLIAELLPEPQLVNNPYLQKSGEDEAVETIRCGKRNE